MAHSVLKKEVVSENWKSTREKHKIETKYYQNIM